MEMDNLRAEAGICQQREFLGEGHLRAEADGIAEERAGSVNRDMATR